MIRGKKLPAQTPAQVTLDTSIHNRFDVEVVDAKTGKLKKKARAFNVVCNGLWTALNKSFSVSYYKGWFNSIAYGTGTGTPSENDETLFGQIGKMEGLHTAYGVDHKNCHVWIRKDISITETMAVGETLTEVGIVDKDGILCTHAMLQDMNGNQISIEKTDTDIVNVYATVYLHFPAEILDVTNPVQVSLNSVTNDYSILSVLTGNHPSGSDLSYFTMNAIPAKGRVAVTGSSTSEKVNTMISMAPVFDVENRTLSYYGRSAAVNNNTPGGCGWIPTIQNQDYAYNGRESNSIILKAVPPVFNGSVVVGEAVGTGDGVTVDFSTKFDLPKNARVYVDGVSQPDVIVDCVPLSYQHMGQYFQAVEVENGVAYPGLPDRGKDNECLIGDNIGTGGTDENVFYNPFYEYGIVSFAYNFEGDGGVWMSDNLIDWVAVPRSPHTVPEEYRNYRYFKHKTVSSGGYASCTMHDFVTEGLTGKNIHFVVPPAEGTVITVDYETDVVTKDPNHVFDLNIVIQLGGHNEM